MSLERQRTELERERDELALKRLSGTTTNIEINERWTHCKCRKFEE